MIADLVLIGCLASTLFMTGLIWFVQVVHYPLFDRVGPDAFGTYHAAHTRSTTHVVIGPMLVELATSVAIVAAQPAGVGAALAWSGLATASASWASTWAVQVPCHDRLAAGYCATTSRRLYRSNWVRVATWTGHSAIVVGMLVARLAS